jgi:hypothetical protein
VRERQQIIIAGMPEAADTQKMLREIHPVG